MDALKNKNYIQYDYISRYTGVPSYYNINDDRELLGLCKNVKKTASYAVHKVTPDDTLHKLALKYYNNPTYWWIIASYNDILDPFIRLIDRYKTLKVPTLSVLSYGDLR